MDLIILEHTDFTLEISQEFINAEELLTDKFKQAKMANTSRYFNTSYEFTDMSRLRSFQIWDHNKDALLRKRIESVDYPVFFENTEYAISIEFLSDITDARIYSRNKEISRSFKTRETRHGAQQIIGIMKFKNSVGNFELNINYTRGTEPVTVIFKVGVFSPTLAVKRDVPGMVKMIEEVYPRLILDYIRLTDHPAYNADADFKELLWWLIFDNIYKKILNDLSFIITHPHTSLGVTEQFEKAEKIYDPKIGLQHKLNRFKGDPNKFFPVGRLQLSEDNPENRVVKFILYDIIAKFQKIYWHVKKSEAGGRMSIEYKAQLEFVEKSLKGVAADPFFEAIVTVSEINSLSHVLLLKDGYRDLIDSWNKLNEGYGLFEGIYALELKSNPYIFRLWCFTGMAEIIKSLGGRLVDVIRTPAVIPGIFTLMPDKETSTRFVFHFTNGNIVELHMNLHYTDRYDENNQDNEAMPDIVLRVRKNDLPREMYFTYLFDTNYRVIKSSDGMQPDVIHENDKARLHYIKDKVHVSERRRGLRSKGVNGIISLYPGIGDEKKIGAAIRQAGHMEVVGMPFNPNPDNPNKLIRSYISDIINTPSEILMNDNKTFRSEEVFAYIPFISKDDTALINYLKNSETPLFFQEMFPTPLGNGSLRYCAPYIEGEGIPFIWEIKAHDWTPRKGIFSPGHVLFSAVDKECLVLKLERKEIFAAPLQIKGVVKNARYTRMRYINKPANGFIKTITEREILNP